MPGVGCQQLAFHLAHTTAVLNSSMILWTALLSTGNVLATRFWTEERSVRDELFLQVQLSGSEQFAVYFCALEAWWVSSCHPPDFSPASSGRNEDPLQRATALYKDVFFPLCQVPWAKLCAALLPQTRTTSQVAESKELRSQFCPHSGQML